jgi:hypothetical protein
VSSCCGPTGSPQQYTAKGEKEVWSTTTNSVSFENLWSAVGPFALGVFPLAWTLVRAKSVLRRVGKG